MKHNFLMQQRAQIYREGSLLVYQHYRFGRWFADWSPVLCKILERKDVSGYLNPDGRLYFKIAVSGKQKHMSFPELCFCCYHGMISTHEGNIYRDVQSYRSILRKDRELDHLDGFVRNNTGLNMSLVSRAVNRSKKQITLQFLPPYYLTPIFWNEQYHVRLQLEEKDILVWSKDQVFDTPEDMLSGLRNLYNSGCHYPEMEESPTEIFDDLIGYIGKMYPYSRSADCALYSIQNQRKLLELVKKSPHSKH